MQEVPDDEDAAGSLRGMLDGLQGIQACLCAPILPNIIQWYTCKQSLRLPPPLFARLIKKLNSQEVKVPCPGKEGKEACRWSVKPRK